MKKKALLFFLIFAMVFMPSCSEKPEEKASDLLYDLLLVSGEAIENSGYLYDLSANEYEIGYFSPEERALLYGEYQADYFSKIEDCALFMSSRNPCEVAVFKCYSASDTEQIVKMCLERSDSIKVVLRFGEWEEKSKNIRISVCKRYVLFCFAENADSVESRFKRSI